MITDKILFYIINGVPGTGVVHGSTVYRAKYAELTNLSGTDLDRALARPTGRKLWPVFDNHRHRLRVAHVSYSMVPFSERKYKGFNRLYG